MLGLPQSRDQAQAEGQAEEHRRDAGQNAVGGGYRGDPDGGAGRRAGQAGRLAGSLGAALTRSMLERRWITSREASRIVTVTEAGEAALRDWPGVDLAQSGSVA